MAASGFVGGDLEPPPGACNGIRPPTLRGCRGYIAQSSLRLRRLRRWAFCIGDCRRAVVALAARCRLRAAAPLWFSLAWGGGGGGGLCLCIGLGWLYAGRRERNPLFVCDMRKLCGLVAERQ